MKSTEPTRRRRVRAVALSGAVLGLAGCATMPSSGPVALGPTTSANTQNTRVELIPVPPADQEAPEQLLRGFLDALGSDQADYRTARLYLNDSHWQPSGAVTVLASTAAMTQRLGPDGKSYTVTVSGPKVATLDAHGSYTAAPANSTVNVDYHFLRNDKGQWRIVNPPADVLTSERDFQRIYESVNLYYPAAAGRTSGGASPLVADPVYIRARADNPLQTAAQQLVNGPGTWLQPVVDGQFGSGAKVELDTGAPQVKAYLTLGPSADWSRGACRTMATQLYTTLSQIQASVTSVALYRGKSGGSVCTAATEGAYNPVSVLRPGTAPTAYYLTPNDQLKSVTPPANGAPNANVATVDDVPGKLVPAGTTIGSFAVSPNGDDSVASVSADGRALYLSNLHAVSAPAASTLHSTVTGALSSPSWDGTGTLWLADSEPGGAPLRAVSDGTSVPVTVQGLSDQATIEQVRVAPDGARIALLVKNGDSTSLEIGRVSRSEGNDTPRKTLALTVDALRPTATGISSITSLAWQDGDGLVVVGQQTGTTSVLPVEMDDSPSTQGAIQALNGVMDVTALPGDPQAWLFATAKSTPDSEIFFSQLTGFRWIPITDGPTHKGSAVRFPG